MELLAQTSWCIFSQWLHYAFHMLLLKSLFIALKTAFKISKWSLHYHLIVNMHIEIQLSDKVHTEQSDFLSSVVERLTLS